ncbi:putative Ni/Fe-hydrogenase B-type cytochrome subunit [Hartmannibacter diazotrophicus]|uniref:Probable Ni/Fe-hydrogenase B-type cytochrome subunit n=1 Tax=Hartmannibacter diazotrophicus TaxID=1482074 RepID=A0A2C9D1A0_9HYPH|nr:Ni/Fe-hydrogenase, b-type cytochrome subunit [Hartmannibacter diazotrophicus]SON53959.1 putative Ni/Fe-hydrogenase B-type cytochrome subunit [Hartmannibacter diazotrophicus]
MNVQKPVAATAVAADFDEEDRARSARLTSVYVYEAPVRLWHWTNAFAILTLAVTGYFIGSPLPTMPGEASANFLMGYIRFAHFTAAYIFAIGFVFRIYWAFVGNHHARQLFLPTIWKGRWWKEVLTEVRWYLFLEKRPKKYIGHNPLAQIAMFVFITLGSIFMIVTGFALYGEGAQPGSWASELFGWVIPLAGQSMDVHTLHHLGMWFILTFVMIHVYVAIREDIMSRQSIVSTMISGHRTFKDDDPE